MPDFAPIPFGPALDTSSEELAGAVPEAFNVIIDSKGTLRKRPGLALYTGVAPATAVDASGVLGLYLTQPQVAHTNGTAVVSGTHPGVLYAIGATVNAAGGGHNAGRNIFKIVGGVATLLTGTANQDRLGTPAAGATTRTPRPIFAETEALLVIAGGDAIAKIDIRSETFSAPNFTNPNPTLNNVSFLGGCPPLATHVLPNSSRILANDTQLDTTKVRFSDITQGIVDFTGHETWDPSPGAAGFFTAEARTDSIAALGETTNDIWVFGTTSLQLFEPDPAATFGPSVTRESGCLARYSPCKIDQQFLWLDHRTRVITSDGRDVNDVGAPVQNTLDNLTTPSDCYSYRYKESFADCLVLRFNADSDTLTYQPGVGWGRWALHDAASDAFTMWPVLSHLSRPDGGLNVVGLEDGRICTLSLDNTTDLGAPIVSYVRTGFLDRGSDNRKRSIKVDLVFKRGAATSGVVAYLEFRDDLSDQWTVLDIDLGTDDGNQDPVVTFRSLGIYRRRQYRLRFADAAQLFLVRAMEQTETLDS